MIAFGAQSNKFLEVIQGLVEGSQSYLGLMARLQVELARMLVGIGVGRLRAGIGSSIDRPLAEGDVVGSCSSIYNPLSKGERFESS
jgi:hypothetical protein